MAKHEFTIKVFRLNFFNSELSVKQIMMTELNNEIMILLRHSKKIGFKNNNYQIKHLIRTYTQRT